MKDERLPLVHIYECLRTIESYTKSGREKFLEDRLIQDAVYRNFTIIGEASKRLSEQIRSKAPHIQWRRIAGFRDVLIHQYEGVDPIEVWLIIENDDSKLINDIRNLLLELGCPIE